MSKVVSKRNGPGRANKLIERGKRTKREILNASVDIASAEGLEGLTIGRLAKDLGMSKSGLFAHFGSKEDLQMATVDVARTIFVEEIILPIIEMDSGLAKLVAMLENWISYVEGNVFKGGCFFFAASAEMDDRPGRVRDLVAELTGAWVVALEDEIKVSIGSSELERTTDVHLLVFQLHSFVQEANWFYRLHNRPEAFNWARRSIKHALISNASKTGRKILEVME